MKKQEKASVFLLPSLFLYNTIYKKAQIVELISSLKLVGKLFTTQIEAGQTFHDLSSLLLSYALTTATVLLFFVEEAKNALAASGA